MYVPCPQKDKQTTKIHGPPVVPASRPILVCETAAPAIDSGSLRKSSPRDGYNSIQAIPYHPVFVYLREAPIYIANNS